MKRKQFSFSCLLNYLDFPSLISYNDIHFKNNNDQLHIPLQITEGKEENHKYTHDSNVFGPMTHDCV